MMGTTELTRGSSAVGDFLANGPLKAVPAQAASLFAIA